MLQALIAAQRWLFGHERASFAVAGDVDAAVARLAAKVREVPSGGWFDESAVGLVTREQVAIYRHRPMRRSAMTPYFDGTFVASDGRAALEGEFKVGPAPKLAFGVWLVVLALFIAWAIVTRALQSGMDAAALARIAGLGLALLGVAFVAVLIARVRGRDDKAWLSTLIKQSLRAP